MEKSVEPIRKKAVIEPSGVWTLAETAFVFFIVGILSCLGYGGFYLVLAFARGWLDNYPRSEKTLMKMIGTGCFIAVPIINTFYSQSKIRRVSVAILAGAAFGAGALFLFGFSMLFNSSVETIVYMLLIGAATCLIIGTINGIFMAILNKVRPLKPIQDGTLCPQCAYSIIGNVSGVCPECGCRELPSSHLEVKTL